MATPETRQVGGPQIPETVSHYLRYGNWPGGNDPERNREVLLSWLGTNGSLPTLDEMGSDLGVTRERVRQLKNRALKESLAGRPWVEEVVSALRSAVVGRDRPLEIPLLSYLCPVLGPFGDRFEFWKRLTDALTQEIHLIPTQTGVAVGFRPTDDRVRATELVKESVREESARLLEPGLVDLMCRAACLAVGLPEFEADVRAELRSQLVVIPPGSGDSEIGRRGATLGVGLSQGEACRSILRLSPAPLHIDEVQILAQAALGRSVAESVVRTAIAEVGFAFGGSIWGLPRHLPLSPGDQALVAEACESIVEDWRSEQEQWHASDLLLLINEIDDLPDLSTLDHYTLSVILHAESDLRYLSRSLWAHPKADVKKREIFDMVEAVLVEAGRPMTRKAIRRRISHTRGLGAGSMLQARGDVVRVGRGKWGLMSRDFATVREGKSQQIIEELVLVLSERGIGFHPEEIDSSILPSIEGFSRGTIRNELVALVRRDDRLWVTHGGMMGLRKWDSIGRMSVREALCAVASEIAEPSSTNGLAVLVSQRVGREIDTSRLYSYLAMAGLEQDSESGMWSLVGIPDPN